MRIQAGQVPAIVQEYFETVLMPAANVTGGGLRAFAVGVVGGLVVRSVPQMLEQYKPIMTSLGMMDAEGMLFIDPLYEEATKALKKSPVIVSGYRVEQADIDAIRDIAHKYSV